MRKILKTIIIVCSLLFVAGCPPAYLIGGTAVVAMILEETEEAERERARELAQKKKQEERQAAQLRDEARQREEAERQEQTRLREKQAMQKEAVVFLADVEGRLKKANWNREALPELLEKISYLDKEFLSLEIRQRLNLAVGLYAYLAEDRQQARNKFKKAKELGVRNPRLILPEVWTPGSIEAFNTS